MDTDEVKNAEKDSQFIGENDGAICYFVDSIYGYEQEYMMAMYTFESDRLIELGMLIGCDTSAETYEAYYALRTIMIKSLGKTIRRILLILFGKKRLFCGQMERQIGDRYDIIG
jgi:hypothetical protein